jgi:hypothetical protein
LAFGGKFLNIFADAFSTFFAEFWAQIFTGLTLHRNVALTLNGEIAIAMRPSSPELKAAVNAFIKTHGSGTMYGNMLMKRYLDQNVKSRVGAIGVMQVMPATGKELNVEQVVSEKIGRETVTYVSNIYKYNVAYTLATEQRDERAKAKAPSH